MIFNKLSILFSCFLVNFVNHCLSFINITEAFKLMERTFADSEVIYTLETVKNLGNDLIPRPTFSSHKGQMGRVCVIGGSVQYTGATYYAAMSSLRAGADLVYILCSEGAVPILKSYSPEIIVLPHYLDKPESVDSIMHWTSRMHSILIGPGLGRDPTVQNTVVKVVKRLVDSNSNIPIIIDADGLVLLRNNWDLFKNSKSQIYLTPNARELNVLFPGGFKHKQHCKEIADRTTVITKGTEDIITNEELSVSCLEPNSWRRCGGQGDILAGSLSTFAHYAELRRKTDPTIKWDVVAAFAACSVVRKGNLLAYNVKRRSMLVTDILDHMCLALKNHFKHW